MDGSFALTPTKRRRSLRLPLELPVLIERGGAKARGYTANLGFGGAFVKTLERPGYGEQIDLWIALLPGTLSRLSCVVRWYDDSGFGVQFLKVSAQDAHAITQLMRAHACNS